jgi:hypothetical protein
MYRRIYPLSAPVRTQDGRPQIRFEKPSLRKSKTRRS